MLFFAPTFFAPFLPTRAFAEGDAPFAFRLTPIFVRVCALLFDLLLEARVNLDVATAPMHFKIFASLEVDDEVAKT